MRSRTLVGPILILAFSFLLPAAAPEAAAQDPASVLETRDPIAIDGNADFTAANGVTGGRGTPEEPFVIEGWRIRVSGDGTGIDVRDTTAPFILRNVDIGPETVPSDGGMTGISLDTVRSAALENSTLDDSMMGLYVVDSSGIRVTNTTFRAPLSPVINHGILLHRARDILLQAIEVSGGRPTGLTAWTVSNLTLEGSTFLELGAAAVWATDSTGLSFRGNAFLKDGQGISIGNGTDLVVDANLFFSNRDGVQLAGTRDVTILGNDFSQSSQTGINLVLDARFPDPITGIRVFHNRFDDNRNPVSDTAQSNVLWDDGYPSGGNYWAGFVGPDRCRGPRQDDCTNRDGIVDVPYTAENALPFRGHVDRFPLVRPYTDSRTDPVARIAVLPTGGDVETRFEFDASNSSDAEDRREFLEVRWDFDGDLAFDTDWSARLISDHRYSVPGSYLVRAEVRDTMGASSVATLQVVVDPLPVRWAMIGGIAWVTGSSVVVTVWYVRTRAKGRSRATRSTTQEKR